MAFFDASNSGPDFTGKPLLNVAPGLCRRTLGKTTGISQRTVRQQTLALDRELSAFLTNSLPLDRSICGGLARSDGQAMFRQYVRA
jgi:hypothetical protein